MGAPAARWWRWMGEQIVCELCPRACHLRPGQRAFCFSRAATEEGMALTDYGRSSGFCLDPIESTPLFHFRPGATVLAFGTVGCNLACRYCQNWDIAASKDEARLLDRASPDQIAEAAARLGAAAVAFTFNDPVLWAEFALDTAAAAAARGLAAVAKTAGYLSDAARPAFFAGLDAASVDLKGFSEDFYQRVCGGHLGPVLDTLVYAARETAVHLEVTTLIIEGTNDGEAELRALYTWLREQLHPGVPLHLTAYAPDHRMRTPATTPAALARAARLARDEGLTAVYTANAAEPGGEDTRCAGCGAVLVGRDAFQIRAWGLDEAGRCAACGQVAPLRLGPPPSGRPRRRIGVRLARPSGMSLATPEAAPSR